MNAKQKMNYFVRGLIVLYILFLSFLVWTSFEMGQPRFNLGTGIITVLLLTTILILSEVFDSFSLGKLFSINREVKKKEEEISKTKKENDQLRDNLIRLTTMFTQIQHQSTTNNNLLFTPEVLRQMLGVVKADEKKEEDLEDEVENHAPKCDEKTPEPKEINLRDRRFYNPKVWNAIEDEAINRYLTKYDISETEIIREVEFFPSRKRKS